MHLDYNKKYERVFNHIWAACAIGTNNSNPGNVYGSSLGLGSSGSVAGNISVNGGSP